MRRHRWLRWRRWRRWDGPAGPLAIVPLAIGLLLLGTLNGCRITPDEIQRIETENNLLREQIQTMRMECEQYRQIQLEIEEPSEEPQPCDEGSDPPPPAPR